MFTPMTPASHSSLSSQSVGRVTNCHAINIQQMPTVTPRAQNAYVEIIEQPASVGVRFRYKCEGRSAGCIRGASSTEKIKIYPTIKVCGYQGVAGVVVSCVTKDGPPYYPHPHNLVGKQTCGNGVCYKQINTPDMICSFPNLGIQCVKKKDIKDSLLQRQALQVDPFGTGFSHYSQPTKINLNALRLCFQVFIADNNGRVTVPLAPVISDPIFDNKTVSDLTITKLSHCSAPVIGGQEVILLCDQVNKDDIQIVFYEEKEGKVVWSSLGKFSPHHVHRKAAICFITPPYKNSNIPHPLDMFIQLRRPSDGAFGRPRNFTFLPLKRDPDGMLRKKQKFEALRFERLFQCNGESPENREQIAVPRTIKQAVRTKMKTNNSVSYCELNVINQSDLGRQQTSTIAGEFRFVEAQILHDRHTPVQHRTTENHLISSQVLPSTTAGPFHSSHQKVEDILAIATEQISVSTTACGFSENPCDDALEKLGSLDLGFDPGELDMNLSEINFDSFSESTALNFSSTGIDMKCSTEILNVEPIKPLDKASCT